MASSDYTIGAPVGGGLFQDKRGTNIATNPLSSTFFAATKDHASMNTALAASTVHGVGYYSESRLNNMTRNDKLHALRLINDAGGI